MEIKYQDRPVKQDDFDDFQDFDIEDEFHDFPPDRDSSQQGSQSQQQQSEQGSLQQQDGVQGGILKQKEKMPQNELDQFKELIFYIFNEDTKSVNKLLAELEPQKRVKFLRKRDADWNTPLLIAVKLGYRNPVKYMEMAEVLLSHGADPRRPDKDKWSCLHECIEKQNLKFAMLIYTGIQNFNKKYRERTLRIKKKVDQILINDIPDFSIELNYSIDSKYIPLVGKLAPSDKLQIVKYRDKISCFNTFAGYDGFSILRRNIHTIYNPTGIAEDLDIQSELQKQVALVFPDNDQFCLPVYSFTESEKERQLKYWLKRNEKKKLKGKEDQHKTLEIHEIKFDETKNFWGKAKGEVIVDGHQAKQYDLSVRYEFIRRVRVEKYFQSDFVQYWQEQNDYLSYEQSTLGKRLDLNKYDKKTIINQVIQDIHQYNGEYKSKQFDVKSKNEKKSVLGLWISRGYPIKFSDLNLILSVIKQQIQDESEEQVLKHLDTFLEDENLQRFLEVENGFPIKMQIPIFYSLYADIQFENIKILKNLSPEEEKNLFEIPKNCKYVSREEILKLFSFKRPFSKDEVQPQ